MLQLSLTIMNHLISPVFKWNQINYFGLSFSAAQKVEDTTGSIRHKNCPVSLHPCARDAYLLFQVNNLFLYKCY